MKKNNILVTGGLGILGNSLIKHLLSNKNKNLNIFILDRSKNKKKLKLWILEIKD